MFKPNKNFQIEPLKFVHITDTHVLNQPNEKFFDLNTTECLESVLSHCFKHHTDIDFLLVTGDISQTGTENSYKIFKSILQKYEIPVFCVPGNHDDPATLKNILPFSPHNSISTVQMGSYSLVLISSWMANMSHGIISENSLQQLDDYLCNNQDLFSIIALHHPPVSVNSKWLDDISLKNSADLLSIISKHSPKSLLLFGHVHQEVDQQRDTLRLLATPSTCHQFAPNCDQLHHMRTTQPAYRLVELFADHTLATTVIYLDDLAHD